MCAPRPLLVYKRDACLPFVTYEMCKFRVCDAIVDTSIMSRFLAFKLIHTFTLAMMRTRMLRTVDSGIRTRLSAPRRHYHFNDGWPFRPNIAISLSSLLKWFYELVHFHSKMEYCESPSRLSCAFPWITCMRLYTASSSPSHDASYTKMFFQYF